jgi:hypothetical protein
MLIEIRFYQGGAEDLEERLCGESAETVEKPFLEINFSAWK